MIEFRMLGAVELSGPDGREVRAVLTQPKRLAVLAYLAASPPRFFRRDTLLALFWPELDQDRARAALRQTLHGLRQALGADAIEGRGEDEIRVSEGALRSDVRAFEVAVAEGDASRALALYRGDLLEGFFLPLARDFERWLETERGRLRRVASKVASSLAERHQREGRVTEAVECARRGLALAPDDEGLLRLLIAALDASGDRAGALQTYEDFARELAREFGAQPAVETQALLAAVRTRQGPVGDGAGRAQDARRGPALSVGAAQSPATAIAAHADRVSAERADAARASVRLRYRAAGVVALAGLVVLLVSRWAGKATYDSDLVVVAPFNIYASEAGAWSEGLVEYLSRSLDGAGALRAVSPSAFLSRWSGRADARSARALAQQAGAGLVVFGSIARGRQDSIRLRATLLDAENGRSLGEVDVGGDTLSIDRVADSLAISLMRELGRTRPVGAVRNAPFGKASLPALKEFLQGERFYRRALYDSALFHHGRAIALDRSFALAYRRLGYEVGWGASSGVRFEPGEVYAFRAASLNHGLTPRDSLLIAADSLSYALGHDVSELLRNALRRRLHSTLGEAVRRFPGDPEAWTALGEARFHVPAPGRSPLAALEAFARAIALDSGFAPAYEHAVGLAMETGGPDLASSYVHSYVALKPGAGTSGSIRLAAALLDPARSASREVATLVDTMAVSPMLAAACEHLGPWADSGETATRLLRAVPVGRRTVAGAIPLIADTLMWPQYLAAMLLYRGHVRESYHVFRPVIGDHRHRPWAEVWNPLRDLALLGAIPADTMPDVIARWDSGNPESPRWMPWWLVRRDSVSLARTARRWHAIARHSTDAFDAAEASAIATIGESYLALVRADTASAIRTLEAQPDSLCGGTSCFFWKFTFAKLLETRGDDRRAGEILDRWLWVYPSPFFVLGRLERAGIAERAGDRALAIKWYRFVAEVWRDADPVLQPYVTQARTGVRRLAANAR